MWVARPARPSRLVLRLAVSAGLIANLARAEPQVLELSWSAPPECPAKQAVHQEFMRIAPPEVLHGSASLKAEGVIVRRDSGYRLTLRTQSANDQGQAEVDSPSCEPLQGAATLLLALAAAEAEPPQAPLPPVSGFPTSSIEGPLDFGEPESERPQSVSKPAWQVALGASTHWSPNLLPEPSLGAALGLWLLSDHFGAFTTLGLWPPRNTSVLDGIEARFSAGTLQLGGCAMWPRTGPQLRLCVAGLVGALRGEGSGTTEDLTSLAPTYGFSPSAGVAWPLGVSWLRLRAAYQLHWLPWRPRFEIAGLGSVYTPPLAVHDVGFGIEAEF